MSEQDHELVAASKCFKSKKGWSLQDDWDKICDDALTFASTQGKERIISISHSQVGDATTVIVWYWQ